MEGTCYASYILFNWGLWVWTHRQVIFMMIYFNQKMTVVLWETGEMVTDLGINSKLFTF